MINFVWPVTCFLDLIDTKNSQKHKWINKQFVCCSAIHWQSAEPNKPRSTPGVSGLQHTHQQTPFFGVRMSESSCLCYLTITYNKMCRALAYTLSIHTLVRLTHSHSLAFYRHLPSALLVSSAYWLYDSLPVRPVYCAGFSIRGLQNRDTAFWGQFFRHRGHSLRHTITVMFPHWLHVAN